MFALPYDDGEILTERVESFPLTIKGFNGFKEYILITFMLRNISRNKLSSVLLH